MTPEALNCPNCGAAVSSDHSQCEFCRARLKTVACAKCMRMMFAGSRFCQYCGAIAAPADLSLDEQAGDCPRCRRELEVMQIAGTHLRGCSECDGVWMAADAFEETCASAERRSIVLGYLRERTARPTTATKIAYVPCPDCGDLMNRANFARSSGVIVDICKPHGVWFDADELPAIIDFIQKGGMEIARQRQLNDLQNERDRLRTESLDLESTFRMDSLDQDTGLHIRTFVKNLFG